jgi:galactokinase
MRQPKTPKQQTPPENGFYMEHFTRAEIADLDRALGQSLGGEISMLRIVMRRFFQKAAHEAEDLEMLADALRILGLSCSRLARIIQTENKLQDRRMDELGDVLNASMTAVLEEMNHSRLGQQSQGGQDGR